MHSETADRWQTGERVLVRGRAWTVVGRTAFAGCDALRLSGAGPGHAGVLCTLLVPFDRPRRLHRPSSIRVVRPRRWLHALRRAAAGAHPAGGLKRTARSAIELLPYQLEPALAMIALGVPRLMIADAVGLGKTIQAGIVLDECAFERESFRALVVAPAGLREQWSRELADRFNLPSTVAGAAWLARSSRELPPEVNPWIPPGIYVTSFDFVKQPEVLRPLEEADWDVLVVDEAHGASLGTARRAAVHAIAVRSRRVLLLTATPHAGDPSQFEALCRIGETSADSDRLMLFNRSRADAGTAAARRTALLPVRLTEAERRMHRLLDRYTARVCREAQARGDDRARLAAIILKKRALSSAASLAVSARRRLALLSSPPAAAERQLFLPLGDEDPLEDEEPDAALAAPGLSDTGRERRWLTAIVEAARTASRRESKTRFLLRLLSRMRQPAIVFTEYRDTLERLRDVLTAAGHHVAVLHGGMTPAERSVVQDAFNEIRLPDPTLNMVRLKPDTTDIKPDATDALVRLKPDTTDIKPDATDALVRLKPDTTDIKPDATDALVRLKPDTTDIKPDATDALVRLKPDTTDIKPDATDAQVRLKPDTTDIKPDATDAQVRLKPDTTDIKPDTTDSKPDATEVLLATDAASEGLNLQRRCRAVVHYELPWSPARLEQRTGRVDRIGQSRRVHEILLVAGDTAERLVLAPLAKRAARAGAAMPGSSRLVDAIAESRVASAVMDGEPIAHADRQPDIMSTIAPPDFLRERAACEARRLRSQREWNAASGGHDPSTRPGHGRSLRAGAVVVSALRIDRSSLQPGLICVYTVTLSTERGDAVHTELAVVHESDKPDEALSVARTPAAARRAIREFMETREPAVRAALLVRMTSHLADVASAHATVVEGSQRREHALMLQGPAARELVQSGLFDGRALRAHAARQRAAATLVEASEERLESLASERAVRTAVDLSAILISEGA